jgi:chemotaxis response regulator CheB
MAVEAVLTYKPDVILIVFSPESMQTCKELTSNIDTRDIPTIATNTTIDSDIALLALNMGCVDFILPDEVEHFEDRVSKYVKLFSMKRICKELSTKL